MAEQRRGRSRPTPRPRRGRGRDVRPRSTTAASPDVKLKIYEPPRFFEAFLRGRAFTEAPDITARICGICPVAYQMSSVQAMEQVCGVEVDGQLRALRRLLYCGEWIESHALHVFMLHAPDFLGYDSAIELARDQPRARRRRRCELKKTGNQLMARDRRAGDPPDQRARRRLVPRAAERRAGAARAEARARARDRARAVRFTSGFDFPDYEQDYELVSLLRAGRVSDRPRPHRLEQRARHRHLRVRRALRRGARSVVERAPLAAPRARLLSLSVRSRALRLPATGSRRGARGGRRGRAHRRGAEPVSQHRGAQRRDGLCGRRGACA